MNIVVIGPGAIGSLWAYHLHQAGHRVSVWSTKPHSYFKLRLDDYPAIELANNQPRTLQQADLIPHNHLSVILNAHDSRSSIDLTVVPLRVYH